MAASASKRAGKRSAIASSSDDNSDQEVLLQKRNTKRPRASQYNASPSE